MDHKLRLLARLGYGARGLVYLLVGGLAVVAAFGSGKAPDSKGALERLLMQPLGSVWVAGIAAGLLLFALWRMLHALLNADHLGSDWKGVSHRIGYGLSAAIYLSLAGTAVSLVTGRAGDDANAETSPKDWTAEMLALPFGQILVGSSGAILCGIGIAVFAKGIWGKVDQRLVLHDEVRQWAIPLGRVGLSSRGVVLIIAGAFLIFSAMDANPAEVKGLAGSLRVLQSQPYGWAILTAVAVGLVAFGLFQFVVAYYREISTDEAEAAARRLKTKVAT